MGRALVQLVTVSFTASPSPMNQLTLILALLSSYISLIQSTPLNYTSVFSFGDSLADTGNLLLSGALPFPSIGHLPYGITFFRHPTGRCSDGRLIVDFIGTFFLTLQS